MRSAFARRTTPTTPASFLADLIPWLAFLIADRSGGVGPTVASISALAIAVTQFALARRRRGPIVLSATAVACFAALGTLFVLAPDGLGVQPFARTIAAGLLGLVMLVTSWRLPVTEPYLRARSRPSRGANPSFVEHNARLSRWWAATVGGVTCSLGVGAVMPGPLPATVLNWMIPLALVGATTTRVPIAAPDVGLGRDEMLGAFEALASLPGPTARAVRSAPRALE